MSLASPLKELSVYYHPEYQRKFLSELIDGINRLKLSIIKTINIIMVTHSPYILSDIPEVFTLKLKDGKPYIEDKPKNTFGANIHDMLRNDFFMENGTMGEFAKRKIEECIVFLNIKNIKDKLTEYNKIESKEPSLKKQIRQLRKEKKELESMPKCIIQNKCLEVINIIGEPVLKKKLKEMYNEYFPISEDEKKEISLLKTLLKRYPDIKF